MHHPLGYIAACVFCWMLANAGGNLLDFGFGKRRLASLAIFGDESGQKCIRRNTGVLQPPCEACQMSVAVALDDAFFGFPGYGFAVGVRFLIAT
ncbi:MAG: hypothetical protein WB689_14360 [Xanthobacteraceae bacterium]